MGYRVVADEHIEPATVEYLRTLGHDVAEIGSGSDLALGADDEAIATYARESHRLILTQDDDFFTELRVEDSAGVLFLTDQTLSSREVGDIITEIAQHIPQSEITLEYVSSTWLCSRRS